MRPNSPLAIKLVAFGELAFIKSSKRSTQPGMDQGWRRLDDDGDLIVVAVNKPVEGHWD